MITFLFEKNCFDKSLTKVITNIFKLCSSKIYENLPMSLYIIEDIYISPIRAYSSDEQRHVCWCLRSHNKPKYFGTPSLRRTKKFLVLIPDCQKNSRMSRDFHLQSGEFLRRCRESSERGWRLESKL